MEWTQILVTVIVALITSTPGAIATYIQRRKAKAEVAEKYEQMAGRTADRMERIEKKSDAQEEEIDNLRKLLFEKDLRISELERRTDAQAKEIQELRQDNIEKEEYIEELIKAWGKKDKPPARRRRMDTQ